MPAIRHFCLFHRRCSAEPCPRVERKHGAVWAAKYRLPDGRQVQRKIGPAWSGRGRPAAGYVTNRLAEDRLHVKAGPVPDKLTIWPVDDGRYGLDATFQGASGYERAEHHQREPESRGVPHKFKQELDAGWTLRFGLFRAIDVAAALSASVY